MKRRIVAAVLIAIAFSLAGPVASPAHADGASTNGVVWCKECK